MPLNYWALALAFAWPSLFAVGGALTVAPELFRSLVTVHHWISSAQFSQSITLAQAAPGPNAMYVGLLGWHSAHPLGGAMSAAAGFVVALLAFLLPTSVLTWGCARWAHQHRHHLALRAFKQGMNAVAVGLMASIVGVLLIDAYQVQVAPERLAVTLVATWCLLRTRLHLLIILGLGAALGAAGWV